MNMATRKAQKSELAEWQKQDAARLKELLSAAKDKGNWPNLDEFASRSIQSTGSYLSQLANGYRPLNLKRVIALAKNLGVDVDKISPTLAQSLSGVSLPAPAAEVKARTERNRRDSEYDRSVFRALDTLDKAVKMSIQNMILAIAAAKNPRHAKWSDDIDQFNHRRDSAPATRHKKKASTE